MKFLQKETLDLVKQTREVVISTNANTQQLILENRVALDTMRVNLVNELLKTFLSDKNFIALMAVPITAGITENIQELLEKYGIEVKDLVRSQTEKLTRDIAIRDRAHTFKLDLISDELREYFYENLETQRIATSTYQLLIEYNDRKEADQKMIYELIRNREETMGTLDYIVSTTERNLHNSKMYLDRFDTLKQIISRIEYDNHITDGQLQHMLTMLNTMKGELLQIGIDNKHKNLQKAILQTISFITTTVDPSSFMKTRFPQLMERGGRRKQTRRKNRRHKKKNYTNRI
jgi:hypothetical protein